ncbi:MAG: hypothetical protein AAFX76_00030 [Planctomycetota bacterium]
MSLGFARARQSTSRWAAAAIAGALTAGATAQDFTWTGAGADDSWLNALNWSPQGVPDAAGETATVGGPAPVVLSGSAEVDRLTVTSGGEVRVGGTLSLLGSPVDNDGQVTLVGNAGGSGGGRLLLESDVTFQSTGRLTLNGADTAVERGGTSTQTFIFGVGTDHTVNGHGELGADTLLIRNRGVIDADVAGQTLRVNPGSGTDELINRNLMQATGGGILELSGLGGDSFFNLATIHAADGSAVLLADGASLNGGSSGNGRLSTAGSGVVRVADRDSAVVFGHVIDGRFEIGDAARLDFGGTITANGRLVAKDGPGGGILPGTGLSTLELLGDVAVDGQLIADAGGTLNVGLVDTSATLTNRGTFRAANGSRLTLDLDGTLDQRGTFEAIDGGVLTVVNGTPVGQFDTTGGIDALTGGTFRAVDGRLNVAPTGFDLVVNDGADLEFHGPSADTNLFADTPSIPGSLVSDAFDTNAGSLRLTGGTSLTTRLTNPFFDFTNAGVLAVGAGSTFAVTDTNGDRRTLNNQTDSGPAPVLGGDGTVFADVFNGFSGEIRPETTNGSNGPATLTVDGDLTLTDESQSGSGGVYLETFADGIDTLVVTGTATLAGALYIDSVRSPFPPDFPSLFLATAAATAAPTGPQEFLILEADTIVGNFDLVSFNGDTSLATRIDFAAGRVFVTIPEPTSLTLLLAAAPLLTRRRAS